MSFTILNLDTDDTVYPGQSAVLNLDIAVTLSSVTIVGEPQSITGGVGTAAQTLSIARGDNPYTKDHNGDQLDSRTALILTASE